MSKTLIATHETPHKGTPVLTAERLATIKVTDYVQISVPDKAATEQFQWLEVLQRNGNHLIGRFANDSCFIRNPDDTFTFDVQLVRDVMPRIDRVRNELTSVYHLLWVFTQLDALFEAAIPFELHRKAFCVYLHHMESLQLAQFVKAVAQTSQIEITVSKEFIYTLVSYIANSEEFLSFCASHDVPTPPSVLH